MFFINGRGWDTNDDNGENRNFFIYINKSYFAISPVSYDNEIVAITAVYGRGSVYSWHNKDDCGVQVLKLCFGKNYQKKRLFFS